MDLRAKFLGLANDLRGSFEERDELVNGMICAALAGEHVLLLGPPGTAKSALARAFCAGVNDAEYFEWLLSRFSPPEELFGPVSLKALKEERFSRVTRGKLPEAHIAFVDEIFKANSGVLNTLLPSINERKFHNDGAVVDIPLRFMVGASNELPEGPELAALYDRFLCRYWVKYLEKADSFTRMICAAEPSSTAQLTISEWDAARAEVAAVTFDKQAAGALFKLRSTLRAQNDIQVSDRRWKRCVKLLKANAWLSGDTEVNEEHFLPLADALWDELDQRDKVAAEVTKVSAGSSLEAKRVFEMAMKMITDLPRDGKEITREHQERLVNVNREVNRATKKLEEFRNSSRTDKQKGAITGFIQKLEADLAPVRSAARQALGL